MTETPTPTAPSPGPGVPLRGTPSGASACPSCSTPRATPAVFCGECGYVFPAATSAPTDALAGRYQPAELIGERAGVLRFRGLDHRPGDHRPVPVVILKAAPPPLAEPVDADPLAEESVQFHQPTPDPNNSSATLRIVPWQSTWPGLDWEQGLLERTNHPALPRVLERFAQDGIDYLVIEALVGRPLREAWDASETTTRQRFGWLIEIAELLRSLHQSGAMLDAVRPDLFAIGPAGMVVLTDPVDVLPVPPPPSAGPRGSVYSAPEWLQRREPIDARADMYGFGALAFSLYLGRELTEHDFDALGHPDSFPARFPDAHPLFARMVGRTFCFHPEARFPTDDGYAIDPTGFAELLQLLADCRDALDLVRLEAAAWTSIGMVRSGNEDAFCLVQCQDSSRDRTTDRLLVLLADGMGGSASGEVAAAMTMQSLRAYLLAKPPFVGDEGPTDPDVYCHVLRDALKEANRAVWTAAREDPACRGMGCTAEAVYIDGRQMVVGHVGDSRVYHLQRGTLRQVTRDQTLVGRLVELGHLTEEEAEHHPRRSELQQAVGGRPDVDPEYAATRLEVGDMVLVCSDGLSNTLRREQMQEVLASATSAEQAARRLVNLANHFGATDNVTVAVIRAC